MFLKKADRRWICENPIGVRKTDIDYILTHHKRNIHQQSQHWKWTQNGYKQHKTGRIGGKENIADQKDTKSRCHKKGSKKI